jgi:hypothetical protein
MRREDLPDTLERSPAKVRRTYAKTLDSAHERYGSEEGPHRTAWSLSSAPVTAASRAARA